jgi:hypothetical protein
MGLSPGGAALVTVDGESYRCVGNPGLDAKFDPQRYADLRVAAGRASRHQAST